MKAICDKTIQYHYTGIITLHFIHWNRPQEWHTAIWPQLYYSAIKHWRQPEIWHWNLTQHDPVCNLQLKQNMIAKKKKKIPNVIPQQRFFHHHSNLMDIPFSSNSITCDHSIAKIGTCHDSPAVVPCAKYCSDHFISFWIRAKWNFHHIWIVSGIGPWIWICGVLGRPPSDDWFGYWTQLF